MIDPKAHTAYHDYQTACKAENEVAADEQTWRAWCKPPLTESDDLLTLESKGVPSRYLDALIQELPAVQAAAESNDYLCKLLTLVIHELRLTNGRVNHLEQVAVEREGDTR